MVELMHLLTSHQVQLTQAVHLFISTKGTATMECTALRDTGCLGKRDSGHQHCR